MVKRICSLLLCLITVFSVFAPTAQAAGLVIYKDSVFYQSGNVIAIDAPKLAGQTIVVQESVNGMQITGFDDGVWWGIANDKEFNLLIPDTVQGIRNPYGDELDHITIISNKDSAAEKFAEENGMNHLTPEENQKRVDSQTLNNKKITVYFNKRGLTVDSDENNYVLADKKVTVTHRVYKSVTQMYVEEPVSLSDGSATIIGSDLDELVISREKYHDIKVAFRDLNKEDNVFYLEPVKDDFFIKGVYVTYTDENGKTGSYDIYRNKYVIDPNDSRALTYTLDIDWVDGVMGEAKLFQSGIEVVFDKYENNTLQCALAQTFDISEDIYLVVTKNEKKVQKKLDIVSFDGLDGLKLDFTEGVAFTLPSSFPLIGGQDIGFNLGGFPLVASVEDGKVSVLVGMGGGSLSYDKEKDPGKRFSVKGLVGDLKDDLKKAGENAGDIKKLFTDKEYRTKLIEKPSAFGASGKAKAMGYIEAIIRPDGQLRVSDSKIVLQVDGKMEWDGQIPGVSFPVYWEVYIKGNLNGSVSVAKIVEIIAQEDYMPFKPVGTLDLGAALGGGIGIGVADLLSAGGGVEGSSKIALTWRTTNWHYKWTGKFSVYAKAKALFWEWNKTWDVRQGTWKENTIPYKNKQVAMMAAMQEELDVGPIEAYELASLYDAGAYRMEDQSYLDESSEFDGIQFMMGDQPYETVVTNVYENPAAQLVELANGTQLLVWIGGVPTRVSPNKPALYWSMRPVNGQWTEPALVAEDGTADFSPVLAASGNTAWLVWQNADRSFDSDVDPESAVAAMEICAAEFDGSKFGTAVELTDNNVYDYTPALEVTDNGDCHVYWLQSASNSLTGNVTDALVQNRSYSGTWSAPQTVYAANGEAIILSVAAGANGYAVALDLDLNLLTTSDQEIYANGSMITSNSVIDSAPVFAGENLYWYQNGTIVDGEGASLLPADTMLDTDNFIVLQDETGRLAVVFSQNNGVNAELCAVFHDPVRGTSSQPVAITDYGQHITSSSGIYDYENERLLLAAGLKAVTGSLGTEAFLMEDNETDAESDVVEEENVELPFGQTDLTLVTYTECSALSIDQISYAEALLVPNTNYTVTVTVRNTGSKPVDAYDVVLWDTPGNMPKSAYGDRNNKVADSRVLEPLAGGATRDVELTFALPEHFEGTYDLTLSNCPNVEATYSEASVKANAVETQQVIFKSDDLIMDAASSWGDGQTPVVTATISNVGKMDYTNLPVNLYAVGEDGTETLVDATAVSIVQKSYAVVTFPLDVLQQEMYKVVVAEQENEINHANNESLCYFMADGPMLLHSVQSEANALQAAVRVVLPEAYLESGGHLFMACYDEDGKMTSVTDYAIRTDGVYPLSGSAADAYTIKLFLVEDGTMIPIDAPAVYEVSVE